MANAIQTAKSILSLSKSLKAFQQGDTRIAMYFATTSMAGRAGLLASAIRSFDSLEPQKFNVMAANEALTQSDLKKTVVPWLEKKQLCAFERDSGTISKIASLILTYDQLLDGIYSLWEDESPHDVERACILALNECSLLPVGKSELAQKLHQHFGNETAKVALELIDSYKLLSQVSEGLLEPLYYSPTIWKSETVQQSARALSVLDNTDKAVLTEIIDRVNKHQGLPVEFLTDFLKQENGKHLLKLAVRTGLLDLSTIQTANGVTRKFLISPHFYADLTAEHGEDFCDRVKIFLDSIRNGQHFGQAMYGKIDDPDRLLEVLVDRGWVGSTTSIGSGYTLPEKAGIVRVEPSKTYAGRFNLYAVQSDTISMVRNIIQSGGPYAQSVGRIQGSNHQPDSLFTAV